MCTGVALDAPVRHAWLTLLPPDHMAMPSIAFLTIAFLIFLGITLARRLRVTRCAGSHQDGFWQVETTIRPRADGVN
jgi:hypothetical protein